MCWNKKTNESWKTSSRKQTSEDDDSVTRFWLFLKSLVNKYANKISQNI